MNILTTIKKYKELLYILGIVIAFVMGTLLGGEGLLWKTQENERENMQLEISKYETAKELRIQIDNIYLKIFELNDEYSRTIKKDSLNNNEKILFKNRLTYFCENYQSFEQKLSILEERTKRNVFIPYPIIGIIERPSTPKFVSFRLVEQPGFFEQELLIKVWVFITAILIYTMLLLVIIVFYKKRIQKKD